MRNIKATLKPEVTHRLIINDIDFGEFKKESNWHGLTRFVNHKNQTFTAAIESNMIDAILSNGESPKGAEIILISPSLLSEILEKKGVEQP